MQEAKSRSPAIEGPLLIDEKKPFEPNLLNSSIYIISICFQINTFAVNYKVFQKRIYILLKKFIEINFLFFLGSSIYGKIN